MSGGPCSSVSVGPFIPYSVSDGGPACCFLLLNLVLRYCRCLRYCSCVVLQPMLVLWSLCCVTADACVIALVMYHSLNLPYCPYTVLQPMLVLSLYYTGPVPATLYANARAPHSRRDANHRAGDALHVGDRSLVGLLWSFGGMFGSSVLACTCIDDEPVNCRDRSC